MVEKTFSINDLWSIDPPCYVRKVDSPAHCKDAASIQNRVFKPPPDNTYSVFLVQSPKDLSRVAIALNANRSRSRITERLLLIALTSNELADIVIQRTTGKTPCEWANHLHHDLVVTDDSQIAQLAKSLVDAKRECKKFNKKAMKVALAATTDDGCYAAIKDSESCVCEGDLPSSSLLSRLRKWFTFAWLFPKSGRSTQ